MSGYHIRSAVPDDAAQLLDIYGHYVENTAVSFEYEPPEEAEFRERIVRYRSRYPYLCAEKDGRIDGFAFAHAFRERPAYDYAAEVSIYIRSEVRRTGLGKLLYTALEDALKGMGVTNLYACIAVADDGDPYLTNASPLFHEHMGFRVCGTFFNCGRKFGRWYTMIWMEKIIGEYTDDPPPLIPYSD